MEAPTRRFFGTRMMETLGHQLNGEVHLAYHPDGFVYTLDAPLASLTAKALNVRMMMVAAMLIRRARKSAAGQSRQTHDVRFAS